jgi:putative peptidoglycan lipid II flippase
VYFVFSHTRLRPPDLEATSSTLAFFSLGMFAWGAQNILARCFYAAHDTLTPAVVGTAITFLNLPVYWLLVRRAQHLGLATASSAGIIAYTAVLFALLNRRTRNRESGTLLLFFAKVTLASAVSGLICFELLRQIENRFVWQTTGKAFLILVVVSTVGFVLVGIVAKLLRIRELDVYLRKVAFW